LNPACPYYGIAEEPIHAVVRHILRGKDQNIPAMNNTVLAAPLVRDGCLLLNPLVWARFDVEGHVLDQHTTQMALVDNQKVVETLFA
jgi:hypothetical protein